VRGLFVFVYNFELYVIIGLVRDVLCKRNSLYWNKMQYQAAGF